MEMFSTAYTSILDEQLDIVNTIILNDFNQSPKNVSPKKLVGPGPHSIRFNGKGTNGEEQIFLVTVTDSKGVSFSCAHTLTTSGRIADLNQKELQKLTFDSNYKIMVCEKTCQPHLVIQFINDTSIFVKSKNSRTDLQFIDKSVWLRGKRPYLTQTTTAISLKQKYSF